jgi:hypothetical protein
MMKVIPETRHAYQILYLRFILINRFTFCMSILGKISRDRDEMVQCLLQVTV